MTLGTRGDVQPFVALAGALDAAGHEAVVCGPHRFEDFVVGHGIRFAGVDDGPMRQLDSPAEAGNVIQGGVRARLRQVRSMPSRKPGPPQRVLATGLPPRTASPSQWRRLNRQQR